jgi:hypothetical protein
MSCIIQSKNDLNFLIKKGIETLYEGSSLALIEANKEEFIIKTIDANEICTCTFRFKKKLFFDFEIEEEYSLNIKLQQLCEFLKKKKNTNSLVFSFSNEGLECGYDYFLRPNSSIFIDNIPDDITYLDIKQDYYNSFPFFSLNAVEFSNIITEIATGGSFLNLYFSQTKVNFESGGEVGTVNITLFENKHVEIQNDGVIKSRYVSKFVKQSCSIAMYSIKVTVYVGPNNTLFIEFILQNNTSIFLMTLTSYQEQSG